MSGTSLDGLDLAWVRFEFVNQGWTYTFHKTVTIPHQPSIAKQLERGTMLTDEETRVLDLNLGKFIGSAILEFIASEKTSVDLIASHGHTMLHQPHKGYTLQIGSGEEIQKITKIPVIFNFRQQDVSLGGQGAPLVPIGDRDLFSSYNYCLNLGGIANISFQENQQRLAYDICPVNMALNALAKEAGMVYDDKGKLARSGKINQQLLNALKSIPYLKQKHPKSLGYEDYQDFWKPLISNNGISVADRIHTMVIAIADEIKQHVENNKHTRVLVTGGGAYNSFLMECLRKEHNAVWHLPDDQTIAFKEALIFAYMGLLRFLGKANTLCSVTGAKKNTSSGKMVGFG